jgi:plasmid stabilization system protein ParE
VAGTALAAVALAGCGVGGAEVRSETRAAAIHAQAHEPADLRATFEQLLGHHATLVARAMRTEERNGPDLLDAAVQALVTNTADLRAAIESLHGPAAGARFEELWVAHVDRLLDFARAAGAGDVAAEDEARSALDRYRDQFGAVLSQLSGGTIAANDAAAGLGAHLDHLMGLASAYAAGDAAGAYALQRQAFAHMFPFGALLAAGLAPHDPASPPAPADAGAPPLRSALGQLLGEHYELAVDAMRAGVTGSADFPAAAAALDGNTRDLSSAMDSLFGAERAVAFNQVWADHIDRLVAYTVALAEGDGARRQELRREMAAVRGTLADAFAAMTGGRLPPEDVLSTLVAHDDQLLAQIEAYAAGDYAGAHVLSFEGYQHMFATAAALAPAIEAELAAGLPVGPAQTGGGGTAPGGPT